MESVEDLLKRIDRARMKLQARPLFYDGDKPLISEKMLNTVTLALQEEYRRIQVERQKDIPKSLKGSTLIIEFARGGPDGSSMPIPFGYEYNLKLLSPDMLKKAAILYVWVTPEESRRKNAEREDPNDPGSILAHCVPLEVMLKDYGCDDIEYLLKNSDREGFIKVERPERSYYLPIERFDNRKDKTSFVRNKVWKEEEKNLLYGCLKDNLSQLYSKYRENLNRV